MNLFAELESRYTKEQHSARDAQRLAQEIAFAPIVFQISRLMVKFGILKLLADNGEGLSAEEIKKETNLSEYAVKILTEASLSIGTILLREDKFVLSKAGWFLLNDELVKVNMNFNHDVNYLGLFRLDKALLSGKPSGLEVFGNWSTIYEGLSKLPKEVQDSWFSFDHHYSDCSFDRALEIVFAQPTLTLLDVGGNTGRWALRCIQFDDDVEVTIMDLPGQLEMMKKQTEGVSGADRISGYGVDLLDKNAPFPKDFDVIWMSQFLDCFSEEEVVSILVRAGASMNKSGRLYIMETLWDRQKYETAAYCLTLTSPYFTAMANGNSKMFHSEDLIRLIEDAGLEVVSIHDNLGMGHSLLECRVKKYLR